MNLNQFTADELAILSAWTDQLALAADLEGGYNPLNTPRLGGLAKLFCDFLLKGGGISIPVINKTGGALAVNKAVAISGYDTVTNSFKVVLADNTTAIAAGVLESGLADGAQGSLRSNCILLNSGLDTSAAALGAPVYLGTSGALTLSAPTAVGAVTQIVGYVQTLLNTVAPNAGGTLAIAVQQPAPLSASSALSGLPFAGASITIAGGGSTYDDAKPASFVNGKPVFATIGGATAGGPLTNPVAVSSAGVAAGNLKISLTGDPGASGAKINVWQDIR